MNCKRRLRTGRFLLRSLKSLLRKRGRPGLESRLQAVFGRKPPEGGTPTNNPAIIRNRFQAASGVPGATLSMSDLWPALWSALALLGLLVLIIRYQVNAFVALLVVSLGLGLAAGLPPLKV